MTQLNSHPFEDDVNSSSPPDQDFGVGAPYAWPGCAFEAEQLLRVCVESKSSSEALDCEFFLCDDYDSDIIDLDRQERFKRAKEWPLPYLVTSAIFHILAEADARSKELALINNLDAPRGIHDFVWYPLFIPFLAFNEPLVNMVQRNNWFEPNKEAIRQAFRSHVDSLLFYDTLVENNLGIEWSDPQETNWFESKVVGGKTYPEDLLRCLHLFGVNETVANLTVDNVFKTESLAPFYDAMGLEEASIALQCKTPSESSAKQIIMVKEGSQSDHILPDTLSGPLNPRHENPNHDNSTTIRLPTNLHTKRSNVWAERGTRRQLKLKNLNQSMGQLLQPIQELEHEIWRDPENAGLLHANRFTPDELIERINIAYTEASLEMSYKAAQRGFTPRQAPAAFIDGALRIAAAESADKFAKYQPKLPTPNHEIIAEQKKCRGYQWQNAQQCFYIEMRRYNVNAFTERASGYVKCARTLQTYSEMSDNENEGTSEDQTNRHKETVQLTISSFKRGLQNGKIPEVEEVTAKMLNLAKVTEEGISTEQPQLTKQEVKDDIGNQAEKMQMHLLDQRRYIFRPEKNPKARQILIDCIRKWKARPRTAVLR